MTKKEIEKTLENIPGIQYEKYKDCIIYQNPNRYWFDINDNKIQFKLIILLNKTFLLFNPVGFENHIMEFNYDDVNEIRLTCSESYSASILTRLFER